jgi:hypothetical protein
MDRSKASSQITRDKRIDFTRPGLTKKWLEMLVEDSRFGLMFTPNLTYDSNFLGFSFSSNQYGLRGQSDCHASTVICGTSFAMGMAVDHGYNWYDYNNFKNLPHFNIGFPVGNNEHIERIQALYKGNFRKLIYIYHPNVWRSSYMVWEAKRSGIGLFDFANWKIDSVGVSIMKLKFPFKTLIKYLTKRYLSVRFKRKSYRIDTKYSYFDLKGKNDFKNFEVEKIQDLVQKFEKVLVFRVPVKEQIGLNYKKDSNLVRLIDNYNENWEIFKGALGSNCTIFDLCDEFELSHYLPNDTHWNKYGNKKANGIFYDNI